MNNDREDAAPAGLAALYAEHRKALLRFLIARVGNAAEAEDVLQEVWLKINQAPSGPIANGRAYLYRVAQNLVLDRLRESRRRGARERDWADIALDQRAEGPEPRAAPEAETAIIAREDADQLARAIEALPLGAGRAFRLHKLEGLSHAETAVRLGISRSGVEKHMAVAMAQLRRALAEEKLG